MLRPAKILKTRGNSMTPGASVPPHVIYPHTSQPTTAHTAERQEQPASSAAACVGSAAAQASPLRNWDHSAPASPPRSGVGHGALSATPSPSATAAACRGLGRFCASTPQFAVASGSPSTAPPLSSGPPGAADLQDQPHHQDLRARSTEAGNLHEDTSGPVLPNLSNGSQPMPSHLDHPQGVAAHQDPGTSATVQSPSHEPAAPHITSSAPQERGFMGPPSPPPSNLPSTPQRNRLSCSFVVHGTGCGTPGAAPPPLNAPDGSHAPSMSPGHSLSDHLPRTASLPVMVGGAMTMSPGMMSAAVPIAIAGVGASGRPRATTVHALSGAAAGPGPSSQGGPLPAAGGGPPHFRSNLAQSVDHHFAHPAHPHNQLVSPGRAPVEDHQQPGPASPPFPVSQSEGGAGPAAHFVGSFSPGGPFSRGPIFEILGAMGVGQAGMVSGSYGSDSRGLMPPPLHTLSGLSEGLTDLGPSVDLGPVRDFSTSGLIPMSCNLSMRGELGEGEVPQVAIAAGQSASERQQQQQQAGGGAAAAAAEVAAAQASHRMGGREQEEQEDEDEDEMMEHTAEEGGSEDNSGGGGAVCGPTLQLVVSGGPGGPALGRQGATSAAPPPGGPVSESTDQDEVFEDAVEHQEGESGLHHQVMYVSASGQQHQQHYGGGALILEADDEAEEDEEHRHGEDIDIDEGEGDEDEGEQLYEGFHDEEEEEEDYELDEGGWEPSLPVATSRPEGAYAVAAAPRPCYCINCTRPFWGEVCRFCGHPAHTEVVSQAALAAAVAAVDAGSTPAQQPQGGAGSPPGEVGVLLAYDDRCREHLEEAQGAGADQQHGRSHPERPERVAAIMVRLQETGLLDRCHRTRGRAASTQELLAVHDPDLVGALEEATAKAGGQAAGVDEAYGFSLRRNPHILDCYFNAATASCARLAAGSAADVAVRVATGAARCGAAIIRPPGHHAESSVAMGFCYYNNAAVAARAAQAAGARRVVVMDWDVHHGNGTQRIFYDDPTVLYMSTHRYDHGTFYPGTGDATEVGSANARGANVNVPWNTSGVRDADMLAAFQHVVVPIAREFRPDLLIISAGFDAVEGDPLGGCRISPAAFGQFTAMLGQVAPLVLLLEGGYNLTATASATEACMRVLLGEAPAPLPPAAAAAATAVGVLEGGGALAEAEGAVVGALGDVGELLAGVSNSAVDSLRLALRVQGTFWQSAQRQLALVERAAMRRQELEAQQQRLLLQQHQQAAALAQGVPQPHERWGWHVQPQASPGVLPSPGGQQLLQQQQANGGGLAAQVAAAHLQERSSPSGSAQQLALQHDPSEVQQPQQASGSQGMGYSVGYGGVHGAQVEQVAGGVEGAGGCGEASPGCGREVSMCGTAMEVLAQQTQCTGGLMLHDADDSMHVA